MGRISTYDFLWTCRRKQFPFSLTTFTKYWITICMSCPVNTNCEIYARDSKPPKNINSDYGSYSVYWKLSTFYMAYSWKLKSCSA
jgi:hypothetical protein